MKLKLNEIKATNKKSTNDEAPVTYFKLDAGQSGKFRFLFATPDEEFETFAVHVYTDGKRFAKFHCPREVGGPFDQCPVCNSAGDDPNMWQKQIVFVPMWDIDNEKVVVWERSVKFFVHNLLNPLFLDKDMCDGEEIYSTVFKITRQGTKQDTSYAINKLRTDNEVVPDGIEIPNASRYIAKKSTSEMMEFLRTGAFPKKEYTSKYDNNPNEEIASSQPKTWETVPDEDVPF